jgi:putative ABC transport system permease protein
MNQQRLGNGQSVSVGSSFGSTEYIWRDILFAVRSLRKAPGFTVVAILVIAVGIGANTAVFSVINTVLLKPLTYPDPSSLVQVINTGDDTDTFASVPKFNIWQQQKAIFQHIAAHDTGGAGLNLTGNDHPEQVQGVHVSADYFATLGATVMAGRTFTASEDSPHGGNVVVLSYGLWKRRWRSKHRRQEYSDRRSALRGCGCDWAQVCE